MQRREFLKTSCSYCLAAGAGLLASSLSSCAAPPMLDAAVVDHKISVPLSAFSQSDSQIVRPNGFLFDIGLHRGANGKFRAFVLQCTHASTQLTPTGDGYTCPEHGSTFDTEGRVTRGPAQIPLRQLPAEVSSDIVVVYLK
ncbi:Rieske (2Fe-2S) protein [bacterium]|nr:MAG: Rieske (2Fe-2S) protein [bacterium]